MHRILIKGAILWQNPPGWEAEDAVDLWLSWVIPSLAKSPALAQLKVTPTEPKLAEQRLVQAPERERGVSGAREEGFSLDPKQQASLNVDYISR